MNFNSRFRFVFNIAILLAVIVTFAGPGIAMAEVNFKGKNITYIIPVSPGGGFDTASRMLIPYLKKYLPGHPNVIVRNTPGGEWNIGISKLYRSKPDGKTVGIMNLPGNAVNQMLGTGKYDLRKITWLGNISQVTYVTALSKKSKYRTLEDCRKAPEIVAGSVGLASTAGLGSIIAAQRMEIKMKPLTHAGSAEAVLAGIRGDVDWVQYPFTTLKKFIIDSKDLVPVWVYSEKRLPQLPDVPTVAELGYKDLLDIVTMYRPVGGPPGMPKDIADAWKKAFAQATNDPEFQQKMIKANRNVLPMTSEETAAMVDRAIKEVKKYKDLILKYRK